MIRSHLVKKYEQVYILSVPDVMDVLNSLMTPTIDFVLSKYVSIVLDVTIVLKGSQLFLKRIWLILVDIFLLYQFLLLFQIV